MAKKKLREFISGRTKWFLVFLGVMILYILGLVGTIIFVHDVTLKVIIIGYEVIAILLGLDLFITIIVSIKHNQ